MNNQNPGKEKNLKTNRRLKTSHRGLSPGWFFFAFPVACGFLIMGAI